MGRWEGGRWKVGSGAAVGRWEGGKVKGSGGAEWEGERLKVGRDTSFKVKGGQRCC